MESLTSVFSPAALHRQPPIPTSAATPSLISFCSSLPSQRRRRTTTPKPTITLTPSSINTTTTSLPLKKVLVPIGFGTEEMEAVILIDVLRRAGADVLVASVEPQLEVETSNGLRLVADTSILTCYDETFDLIALPGGMPGSARLRDCEILRKITSKQAEEKRLYGAICAAPAVTLLPWGLLRRKQTTCHPAFMDKLPSFWAVKSKIQVSGELTTSRGPGTAFEFALSLVEQLLGEHVAKEVGELLLLNNAEVSPKNEEFHTVEWSVDHIPRVLIPISNGSEEVEVVTIVDILRRAKADVVVASVEKTAQILASRGTKIVADTSIDNAAESIYDLIILPSETAGAERLHKSKVLKRLLKEQDSAGRFLGAVGSSSLVLQNQGFLKKQDEKAANELSDGARVVIDGKVITSRGVCNVTDLALAIVSKLFSHGRARSVAEGLVFEYPRT